MVELCLVFFFKQKTAYEMRISDWSSDVCSSDLHCCQHCIMTLGHDLQHLTARATSSASMILSCGLSLGGFPTKAGQSMTGTIESLPDITLRKHETDRKSTRLNSSH